MILTEFLYIYLTTEDYNWNLEEYPFEITEEDFKDVQTNAWGYESYPSLDRKADDYINAHGIETILDDIVDYDLEKAYLTKRLVFKYDDKYYEFEYDYSYNWTDDEPIGKVLNEVHPKQKTITVYE